MVCLRSIVCYFGERKKFFLFAIDAVCYFMRIGCQFVFWVDIKTRSNNRTKKNYICLLFVQSLSHLLTSKTATTTIATAMNLDFGRKTSYQYAFLLLFFILNIQLQYFFRSQNVILQFQLSAFRRMGAQR